MHAGHDYVLVGRRAALGLPFGQMRRNSRGRSAGFMTPQRVNWGARDRTLHQSGSPGRQNASRAKNRTVMSIDSTKEHHPRHCALGDRIDWLAIFCRHAAAGEAERAGASTAGGEKRPARSRKRRTPAPRQVRHARAGTAPPVPGTAAPRRDRIARGGDCRFPAHRHRHPTLHGSIDLKGGRIDDLSLEHYRETVDPNSPPIVLLSPSGAPDPFYAEFGWTAAAGTNATLPTPDTVWKQDGSGALALDHPVTLSFDNGEGLNSAAPSRSTTIICSRSRTRWRTRAPTRSRCFPTR